MIPYTTQVPTDQETLRIMKDLQDGMKEVESASHDRYTFTLLVPDLYHSYMEVNMVMTMTLLDIMIIAKNCHLKLQETATVIGNCT